MIPIIQAMAGAAHGGAEAFFERLTIALHKAGVPQHVLIRSNSARAALLRDHGVSVEEFPFGGWLDFRTGQGFRKAIATHHPKVVLTWMNRATRFCPKSNRGGFVHAARLGGYYDLKYYQACDHLIGNTPDICQWITGQGWDERRVHYLPNFVRSVSMPAVDRSQYHTPATAPLIVTLGRLHENKAFDTLIQAMTRIPAAHLWIAGEGPLRLPLGTLAAQLGIGDRIHFLGWRDDVPALLAAADLFICPSRHEPLGNVILDAWSQAVPVIAAAAQGPSQLIRHGENGLLVPIDEPDFMAQAANRLLNDPTFAQTLGLAGQQTLQHTFSEPAVVSQYVAFLNMVGA